MSAMRCFRELVLLLVALSIASHADSTDLRQYLRDHYEGKTFVLRSFSAGDHLFYNSSGELTKGASSDDWTTNGFIRLDRAELTDGRLSLEATRLVVISEQEQFRLHVAMRPGPPNREQPLLVEIEADLVAKDPASDEVDRLLSKIFLTSHDRLSDLVADYWKPCVPQALAGKDKICHFSSEILAVLGIARPPETKTEALPSGSSITLRPKPVGILDETNALFHVGGAVSAPRLLEHHEPPFSDAARAIKYQGTMTLGLIVDKEGVPGNLRILKPLGCGLDWQAIQAVSSWRFQPAEKDGQPVRVEIAVEVDFRLY